MDVEQYLRQLRLHGDVLADAAASAPPSLPVPSCPGWTIERVLGHLAKVHRWAAWVGHGGEPADFRYQRPEPESLLSFFRAGLTELIDTLHTASDARAMHTLWPAPGSPRLFWARRQAHETAIHRVDVQLAVGFGVSEFDPEFAADGLDELLVGMLPTRLRQADPPRTLVFEPLDANASWTVQLSTADVQVRREAASGADLAVFGMSSDLYRWAWNRAGDDEVSLTGNLALADWWHASMRIDAR